MKTMPLIGICASINKEQTQQFILRDYFQAILSSGAVPVMLSYDMNLDQLQQLLARLDGVLLAGGNDIDPARFGQTPMPELGEVNPLRDAFEWALLTEVFSHPLPLLGICRGIQMLNVFCGGTLYQDLPTQHRTLPAIVHQQAPPYEQFSHNITVERRSLFGELYPKRYGKVNSMHHQAVWDVAPCLQACAWSDDGIVEALYHPHLPYCIAVQWHPERLYGTSPENRALFDSFVSSCRKTHVSTV